MSLPPEPVSDADHWGAAAAYAYAASNNLYQVRDYLSRLPTGANGAAAVIAAAGILGDAAGVLLSVTENVTCEMAAGRFPSDLAAGIEAGLSCVAGRLTDLVSNIWTEEK